MGMPVDIYRSIHYRSTLNAFDLYDELTIVNVPGPFEPTEKAPAAMLVPGHSAGDLIVVAAGRDDDSEPWARATAPGLVGPMFGGTYAATSDSRWSKAVKIYGAIPIHDQYETPEEYEEFST